ncbi:MAG: glucosaminidase domain-containing protein [Phycisphaerae bacterium]|nr:glucosaminidase domain-containing protein [Saprospiraceae bacterium]
MIVHSKFSIFTPKTTIFSLLVFFCTSLASAQADAYYQAPVLDSAAIRDVAQIVSDSFGSPVYLVEEFIREAKEMERDEGIPATAFIGIAILESTGFTSYLYQNAKNPFGMRATKIWHGPTFVMWHEGTDSPFRKYDNPRGAVRDFAAFLNSRKWFRDALACPTPDLECFLTAMSADPIKKEPGYAADPEWANKIRRVIKKYSLDRLE